MVISACAAVSFRICWIRRGEYRVAQFVSKRYPTVRWPQCVRSSWASSVKIGTERLFPPWAFLKEDILSLEVHELRNTCASLEQCLNEESPLPLHAVRVRNKARLFFA